MTTQVMGARGLVLSGNGGITNLRTALPGSSNPRGTPKSGGRSFDDIFAGSQAAPVKPAADSGRTEQSAAVQETGSKTDPAITDGKQPDVKEQVSGTESSKKDNAVQKADQDDAEGTSDEELEALAEKIAAMVKDLLGLSQQQFDSLMSKLGFKSGDLANTENLKELIVANSGQTDVTALLTDDGLLNQLREMTKGVDELLAPSDDRTITKEDLAELLAKAKQPAAEETVREDPKAVNAIQAQENAKTDVKDTDNGPQPEQAISVTVEKESTGQTGAETEAHTQAGEKDRHGTARAEQPAVPAVEAFINRLSNVNLNDAPIGKMQPAEFMREVVNQIVEQVKVVVKADTTSMEMQLNPEQLGKVHISVTESKNGQMTAAFTVQNEAAREAVESQIQLLRDNLDKQGLKVDAVEVTVSEFGFNQNQGQQQMEDGGKKKGPRRINLNEALGIGNELPAEEGLAADILRQSGNSVDYTA